MSLTYIKGKVRKGKNPKEKNSSEMLSNVWNPINYIERNGYLNVVNELLAT